MRSKFNSVVLFGGNGFIGSHFAAHLIENELVDNIYIADIEPASPDLWPKPLTRKFAEGKVTYVRLDVREKITSESLPKQTDLIVNLAAVHREPGHEKSEYFATNIPGAENVCEWAKQINCDRIIFTSTIAVYGATEERATMREDSLTMPLTPYGVSKLTAEKIHIAWQKSNPAHKLLIVRPGVIFGPNEKGNVSRMVKAILGRYFFFTSNQGVRKAGGYVKELCESILFMMDYQDSKNEPTVLYNFTMDPAPSVQDFAKTIAKVGGVKRNPLNVPLWFLLLGSQFFHIGYKLLKKPSSINPTRIRKLLRYNDIEPTVLRKLGYKYKYSLEDGLSDWRKNRPDEW